MLRINKSYTHKEWEIHYDELLDSLQHLKSNDSIQNIQNKIQIKEALMQLRLTENHDEYHHQPDKLLASLIRDVKSFCDKANEDYLFTQSIETRLFILKMRSTISRIQKESQQVLDNEKERIFCQKQYDKFCAELAFFAGELHFSNRKKTYDALSQLLNKYYVSVPIITQSALTQKDFDDVQDVERIAYERALAELQATISALPSTWQTIKDDSNELINKIESSRLKKQVQINVSRDTAFDYVRHTCNIQKTNELLKQPYNTSVQNEYVALIQRNRASPATQKSMSAIVIGAVLMTIGIVLMFSPPVSILVGAIALGVGITAFCGGMLAPKVADKQKRKHTESFMSQLFAEVKRLPSESNTSVIPQENESLLGMKV